MLEANEYTLLVSKLLAVREHSKLWSARLEPWRNQEQAFKDDSLASCFRCTEKIAPILNGTNPVSVLGIENVSNSAETGRSAWQSLAEGSKGARQSDE